MTVSSQTCRQVAAVLGCLVEAARCGGPAALAGLAAPEIAGFWIDRAVHGPAEFAEALTGTFALADLEIACEGTIAWVTARMVPVEAPATEGRFTAVLRGTGHAWLLAQVHASLPA
ncbi:MAG: nuclear transport factor 2 family protein [Methanospirillum sp.]